MISAINTFAAWLSEFLNTYVTKIYNIFIDLVQYVINTLPVFLISLVDLFTPD